MLASCSLWSNRALKIDCPPPSRLKGELHDSVEGSNEVFGGEDGQKCRCHWLLPLPARFPAGDAAARIFGYCTGAGSRGGGGGGRGRSIDRGQTQALIGGRGSLGGGGGGGAAAVTELELAENGHGSGFASRRSNGHNLAGTGGGGEGDNFPAPEAELGLRRSARQSLDERLEAMPEVDSGSEGEFR